METAQKKTKFVPMWSSFFLLYASVIFILLAFIANGIWFSRQVSGLSEAINLAGSEKMRTYQIAFLIIRAYNESSPAREETLGHARMEMDRFEEILNALKDGGKKYNLRDVSDQEADAHLKKLILEWEEVFKPQLNAVFMSSPENRTRILSEYGKQIHDFVEYDIDGLVVMLVRKMNRAERLFVGLRYVLTAAGILLLWMNLLYLRRRILYPISVLMRDTDEVTKGNYAVRSDVSTPNEFMLLAERFNTMTNAISTSFSTMEETIRKRTEELALNNARMQGFFDSAPDAIISIKAEDRSILRFSRGAEKMFGYSAEEVLGRNVNMLMPEPYHANHEQYVKNYLETGVKKIIGIIRHVKALRKSGEIFEIDLSVSEIMTSEGRIFNGIIRDISAQAKAEREMKKLFNAVEQSEDSIVITDIRGAIEYVNPAFERITGYIAAEVIGKNPRMLKSGRQSKEFYEAMWKTILSGNVWRGELVNKKKNNELYYEQATISPVKDEKEEITHFVAMKSDITARKIAEQEIDKKNRELELISKYEHTYARIMELFSSVYDEKVILNGALSALAEEQHYPVSAIYLYDDWSGSLHCAASHGTAETLKTEFMLGEGIIGQAAAELKKYVLSGADSIVDMRIETGIVSLKPAAIIAEPILYQEKIIGVLVLASTKGLVEADNNFISKLSDQTGVALNSLKQFNNLKELSVQLKVKSNEITEKNIELEESNRLKSEFLANMSHELRTPMNAIIGFSEVLKDGMLGELAEDQKSYVADIFSSGKHLLSLINDILDLSKIEAGKMTLDLEPVDIPSTLENSLSMIKEKAMAHNVRLALDVDTGIGLVRLDARKFKQIIYNLLSNAVKFTPNGGAVSVQARLSAEGGVRKAELKEGEYSALHGNFLEISVTDTGIGMKQEDLGKLFRPFEQLDGSTSRKYEGTGLGLAMVRKLAELHNGTVEVASEPGKGSVFTVRLPYRRPEEKEMREEQKIEQKEAVPSDPLAAEMRASPLVLIIEDEDNAADLIRRQLESAGYRTVRAPDATMGMKLASSRRPDIITLDILLPGMDGWIFLSKIKEDKSLAGIPVVIVSIVADEKKGIALGAATVLQKPVQKEALITAVENIRLSRGRASSALKVLVVDDDPKAVDIVSRHLENAGMRVLKAYGGKEGIDTALEILPDLIILDLMMPETSGFDVVAALRARPESAAIPIIILTAKVITGEDMKALRGQVAGMITKAAFSADDLLTEVKRAHPGKVGIGGGHEPGATLPETAAASAVQSHKVPLVLVVEDNSKEAGLLKLYLEDAGYRVIAAANGKQALDIMRKTRPDLITLDLMMPEMDGFAFLDEKAKQDDFAEIPVVIVSGIAGDQTGPALSANAFLKKPVRRNELLGVLSTIGPKTGTGGKIKILLIDDDPKAITILSTYLAGDAYAITKAYGGREGLDAAVAEPPDLIVLDLMMPEMNGFEVLDRFRSNEATRGVPVVVLTAKILTTDERKMLSSKVQMIAEKGRFHKDIFLKQVRSLIAKTGRQT